MLCYLKSSEKRTKLINIKKIRMNFLRFTIFTSRSHVHFQLSTPGHTPQKHKTEEKEKKLVLSVSTFLAAFQLAWDLDILICFPPGLNRLRKLDKQQIYAVPRREIEILRSGNGWNCFSFPFTCCWELVSLILTYEDCDDCRECAATRLNDTTHTVGYNFLTKQSSKKKFLILFYFQLPAISIWDSLLRR